MVAWLESLPRFVLALLFVVGALVVMYFNEPPKSVCDAQFESVNDYLLKHVYMAREDGWSHGADINTKYKFCLRSNSRGGCSLFFDRLNRLEKQMRKVPDQCAGHEGLKTIRAWHYKGMDLLTKIAWGTEKPEFPYQRKGWLDPSAFALFCRLKQQAGRLYGPETLKEWADKTHKSIQDGWFNRHCVKSCEAKTQFDDRYTVNVDMNKCIKINNPVKINECLCGDIENPKTRAKCFCQREESDSLKQECRCKIKCSDPEERLEIYKEIDGAPTLAEINETSLFHVPCHGFL